MHNQDAIRLLYDNHWKGQWIGSLQSFSAETNTIRVSQYRPSWRYSILWASLHCTKVWSVSYSECWGENSNAYQSLKLVFCWSFSLIHVLNLIFKSCRKMVSVRSKNWSRIPFHVSTFILLKIHIQRTWDQMTIFHAEVGYKSSSGPITCSKCER